MAGEANSEKNVLQKLRLKENATESDQDQTNKFLQQYEKRQPLIEECAGGEVCQRKTVLQWVNNIKRCTRRVKYESTMKT